MTAYTTIPDTDIAQDKPIKAETGLALRDNAIAISEGAAGAPQIQRAAIQNVAIDATKIENYAVQRAKIQNSAIDSTKLNLGSSSATAVLPGSGSAEITMSELSFFPMINSSSSDGFAIESKPTATRGFRLRNLSEGSQTYTVSWRFIG